MEAHWLERPDRVLTSDQLNAQGVHHQVLPVEPDAHQGALDRLKSERGYVSQDVIELRPDMEGLETICAKFVDEHIHDDDEVRFVLAGEGLFDIRSRDDRFMRVRVEAGDLIVVPAARNHRFFLTGQKQIRCVRLFKDQRGWVPHYRHVRD